MAVYKEGHIYATPKKRGCFCLIISVKGNDVTYIENFGKGFNLGTQTLEAGQWRTLIMKDTDGCQIGLTPYDESKYRSSKNFVKLLVRSIIEELKYLSLRSADEGWSIMPEEFIDLAINDIPEDKAEKPLALLRESARCSNLAVLLEDFEVNIDKLE